MKTFMTLLSFMSLSAATSVSTAALAGNDGVQIHFRGQCHMGNASVNDGDIEFLNLNMDINADQGFQSKKCEITAKFPTRRNHKLVVSTFKVEALASIKENGGAAILTLRHNFRDKGWKADESRAVRKGDQALVVQQTAVGNTNCDEEAQLKTEIISAGRKAILLQDSATNIIKIKYSYERCR